MEMCSISVQSVFNQRSIKDNDVLEGGAQCGNGKEGGGELDRVGGG